MCYFKRLGSGADRIHVNTWWRRVEFADMNPPSALPGSFPSFPAMWLACNACLKSSAMSVLRVEAVCPAPALLQLRDFCSFR